MEEETKEEYKCTWKSMEYSGLDLKQRRNPLFALYHFKKSPLKFFKEHLGLLFLVF